MAQIEHGTVSVTIDDSLTLPERAGNMSPDEVRRLPKARHGIGLVGTLTADALSKAGPDFILPAGVTPDSLRAACKQSEDIDQVAVDLEVILQRVKQANLIFDADAWEMLRKINDQVKAQAKYQPELETVFSALREFMNTRSSTGG